MGDIALKRTSNYSRPTWEKSDFIQMSDFNDLTQKLDSALKSESDARSEADGTASERITALTQTVTSSKICRVKFGTYTGTGLSSTSNPNTLECGFCPVLFIIVTPDGNTGINQPRVAVRGYRKLQPQQSSGSTCYMTWNDTGLSWYASTAEAQFNTSGSVYYYVVLGYDAD